MSDAVYILQSGQKLNASKFCRYIGRKIIKTGNKFGIKPSSKIYCLDDAAIDVIYSMMAGKKAKLKKSAFINCLKKELELYSKLRKLKFGFIKYSGLKLKIKEMLDSLEEKHMEIKYSVVKAQLQSL
jgi:hypothetical protein